MNLTERQRQLLEAIINEFFETAQAVGSLRLSDKYNLGVSPATLRSEMARLVSEGYLSKEHTSSGRIPTTLGIRYFLDELLEEESLNTLQEIKTREKIYQRRFDQNRFIKEAVKALSELSNQVAVAYVNDSVYISGLCQLLSMPEFEEIKHLRDIINILESENILISIFSKFSKESGITVLIGDEHGVVSLKKCSLVFAPFNYFRGKKGYIGVLGPYRMDYSHVIPSVRSVTEFMDHAISGWQ